MCVRTRERERERWHTRQFHSASADCETSDKINSDASRWRPDTFLFFVPSRCVWVIWFILPFCAKRWTISVRVSWLALSSHNQCIITAWSASFCLVNKSVWWVCSHLVASLLLVSIHFTLLLPKIFIFPLFQTSYDKCKLVFCTGMIVFPSMVRSVTSCSLMCFTSLRLLCQPPVAGEQVSILSRVPPTRPHTKHQAPSTKQKTDITPAHRALASPCVALLRRTGSHTLNFHDGPEAQASMVMTAVLFKSRSLAVMTPGTAELELSQLWSSIKSDVY